MATDQAINALVKFFMNAEIFYKHVIWVMSDSELAPSVSWPIGNKQATVDPPLYKF